MSLPKKLKKLNESQTAIKEKTNRPLASNNDMESIQQADNPTPIPARNEQMVKAFEIVDHIERIHGDPSTDEPGLEDTSAYPARTSQVLHTHEGLLVKMSLNTSPSSTKASLCENEAGIMPIFEVKLRIPSFFWKTPILKGLTENLIKRFAKM